NDHEIVNQCSHSLSGSLTKIRAAHTIKFGAEERIYYNNSFGDGPNLQFMFARTFSQGPNPNTASSNAGYGLATFLLGDPTAGQATRYAPVTEISKFFAPFVQDDWKATPRLTLNLGFRWEFQAATTDRFNALSNFNPGIATNAGGVALRGGLEFPGVGGLSRGNREGWFRDVGPRFGF